MTLTPNSLPPNWTEPLSSARPFEISYNVVRSHKPVAWGTEVLPLQVDARPLAVLAQSALLGHRVYELFPIQRPGDVLRYLWVRWAGEPSPDQDAATWFRDMENQEGKSFLRLDRKHWRPESDWLDDDAFNATRAWRNHRRTSFWATLCVEYLDIVTQVQTHIRSSPDELIRQELALMDAGQHRRDLWPTREQIGALESAPAADTALPPELFELILALARQDVRSVSCPFTDPALWRALAQEQLRRAKAQGLAPQDALLLAGPEGGIPHVRAEDWGGCRSHPLRGLLRGRFVHPAGMVWHRPGRRPAWRLDPSWLVGSDVPVCAHAPGLRAVSEGPDQSPRRVGFVCTGWRLKTRQPMPSATTPNSLLLGSASRWPQSCALSSK